MMERQSSSRSSNSKPASNSNIGSEGFVAQAITIDDAGNNKADFESRLAEETQRLQQDLDTQLQRQQEESQQKEKLADERKIQSRKKRCIILVVLALAAIAGVAAYFATGQGDDTGTGTKDTVADAPLVPVETASPSSDLISYKPPSPVTCKLISQGNTVESQSEMISESFIISLEASLRSEIDDSMWLPDLKIIMQEKLMPLIVGCPDEERRLLRSSNKAVAYRSLEDFDKSILGNAQIDMDYGEANICSDGKALCQRFDLKIDISAKGTVENFSELIRKHIDDALRGTFPMSKYLQVDQTIKTLGVRGVDFYIPSKAPSLGPTVSPSLAPTATPTISVSPTFNGQTFPPTRKPSMAPSKM
jgi:hypothetical protein